MYINLLHNITVMYTNRNAEMKSLWHPQGPQQKESCRYTTASWAPIYRFPYALFFTLAQTIYPPTFSTIIKNMSLLRIS